MLSIFQIIILTIWAGVGMVDGLSFGIGMNGCIMSCVFTGLVVGNVEYGLIVGGTLQLTQLGVGTYGGATVLDIKSAGMITTALGANSGVSPVVFASSLGIGIASLLTLLDIMGRTSNTVFQHACDGYVAKGDTKGITLMNTLGTIPWMLSRALPVCVFLMFGQGAAESFMAVVPPQIISGFKLAGGVLPAVGFAILMRYLPVKKTPQFLIIGFVLAAYLKISVLGISLIGVAMALVVFQNAMAKGSGIVGGNDYDE